MGQDEAQGRFEMYRRDWNDISINDPSSKADDARLGDDEDQWNFSGGGPIIKDSLWWYLGYSNRETLSTMKVL